MNAGTSTELLVPGDFQACLEAQRAAHLANPYPTLEERTRDLRALHRLLVDNRDVLLDAVNDDYGCRSRFETLFAELLLSQEAILHSIRHLRRWMKPQKRPLNVVEYPLARARVVPQPLGVVGVVVPWNFPIFLSFGPLNDILAAGNRAMVKMSTNSDRLARLLMSLSPKYLPEDKLRFFADGKGYGAAFTSLPFDHLIFTGSPETGRSVMANAARNLTPVTLELGGKSPGVVAPDFPVQTAAERILWAKCFNAGQICTNVDYLFLSEGQVDAFVEHARRIVNRRYPDINGDDYTAIIDQRSYDRLGDTLADARAKGARVVDLFEGQRPDAARRKFPLHLVLDPNDDMIVMQREIFGPLLPVITYRTRDEVVRYVNSHPRPLALYVFTRDKALQRYYLMNTLSGGVTFNDCLLHTGVHSMPFGGVGTSGMGHYHGHEGFLTFSKLRPVVYQGPVRAIDLLTPPYAGWPRRMLDVLLRLKS
jgi:coniferyl-aldehyde dehydrogenase